MLKNCLSASARKLLVNFSFDLCAVQKVHVKAKPDVLNLYHLPLMTCEVNMQPREVKHSMRDSMMLEAEATAMSENPLDNRATTELGDFCKAKG